MIPINFSRGPFILLGFLSIIIGFFLMTLNRVPIHVNRLPIVFYTVLINFNWFPMDLSRGFLLFVFVRFQKIFIVCLFLIRLLQM